MDDSFGRRSVVAWIGAGDAPEAAAPAPDAERRREFVPSAEKYERLAPIGAGGMGEVILVHDRDLRRDVAMKLLREELAVDEAARRRFVAEAQATSQLEHPGVPPVHDIGVTPQGRAYFTMKVVRGETLGDVLKKLVLGAKETRRTYSLHKLVTVMERIAETCHFAHERGLVHRDLKPENVMLGEFGEVHVMDWGIAKSASGADEDDAAAGGLDAVETVSAPTTQAGAIKGTIPYMSPEQARGEPIDRRTDVWALGAVLYEILTLHPAFEGGGLAALQRVRAADFADVATRNPRRPVPEPLAAACRRAMSRDPSARHADAREFGDDLRTWLDGRAERERRHRDAEALAVRGREALERCGAARRAIDAADDAAREAAGRVKPWAPFAEKRPLREARRAADDARRAAALAFAETTGLLEAALVAEADNANARRALADLWRGRVDEAERRADAADAAHALTMVRRYDDGRLAAFLAGAGSLEIETDPPGARVELVLLEDHDGLLVPGPARDLGAAPLGPIALPMGSYLCVLRRTGFRDVRYPVHVTRERAWRGRVRMRTDAEIGEGFVLVPGGPFVYGEGADVRVLDLPDFAVAASPVTFADWAEFLAAVERGEGRDAAARLVPNTQSDGDYMERGEDGAWRCVPVLVEGPARERNVRTHGADFESRLPVSGVSWPNAVAYCAWKTRTSGAEWRLPTEEEREKAARGVDGRRFPWGDVDDPTLAKCQHSRDENAQPEPVGMFPSATSVYGVLDAAGDVSDWTSSWIDARASVRVFRGGAWSAPVENLRCAWRGGVGPGVRGHSSVGLRPARSLAP